MHHACPFLAACLFLASACSAPSASIAPAYGSYGLGGEFSATDGGASASSSMSSLGLDDATGGFSPRADLAFLGFDLSLSALSTSLDGSGTTEGDIVIGGSTISGGANVDTDMSIDTFSGVVTWDLIPSDLVDFGLGVGVTVVSLDMEMEETVGGTSIETDETIPIPLLAARGSVGIGDFEVLGRVGYMNLSVGGTDVTFVDYDIALMYHLFGGSTHGAGNLAIGYRGFDLDAEYDDGGSTIEADFTLDGPYVGLSISF